MVAKALVLSKVVVVNLIADKKPLVPSDELLQPGEKESSDGKDTVP
jgi:hypothetical protein